MANSKFPSVDISKIDANNLLIAKKIAGIEGRRQISKNCRNLSNITLNDSSWPPANHDNYEGVSFAPADVNTGSETITLLNHGYTNNKQVKFTSTVSLPTPITANQTYFIIVSSSSQIQLSLTSSSSPIDLTSQGGGSHAIFELGDGISDWWETIEDNPSASTPAPFLTDIWGNNGIHACDGSSFKDITSSVTLNPPTYSIPSYGTIAYTQVFEEELTGIQLTNILGTGSASLRWEAGVKLCNGLNSATTPQSEKWRLPTQKEALLLYITGIKNILFPTGLYIGRILSSTTSSGNNVFFGTYFLTRTSTSFRVICVR